MNSTYFLQTKDWAEFWLEANLPGHNFWITNSETIENTRLSAVIYQYPWHFKTNFLYIPKGPFLENLGVVIKNDKTLVEKLFQSLALEVAMLAKKQNSVFIKWDLDDNLSQILGLGSAEEFRSFVQEKLNIKAVVSSRKIQYLETILIDTKNLKYNSNLQKFFELNTDFWAKIDKKTRYGTRKSLEQNWEISIEKTEENFEIFWNLMQETSERQGFTTQAKNYFRTLLAKEFSHLLIYKKNGIPQGVWFGVNLRKSLIHLYGANTLVSREDHGQYFAHLLALQLCAKESIETYDLGGFDDEKGYGKFKQGYNGDFRTFLGPVDIIQKNLSYNLISGVTKIRKIAGGN